MNIGEYVKMKDMLGVLEKREEDKIKRWEEKEMIVRLENYNGFVKELRPSQFRRVWTILIYEPIQVVESPQDCEAPKTQDYEFIKVLKETRKRVEFLYKQIC